MDGHFFGFIYDANNAKIITNANISSHNNSLAIAIPSSGGVYFACGDAGHHDITVSADNYSEQKLRLHVRPGSFEQRDIYLYPR